MRSTFPFVLFVSLALLSGNGLTQNKIHQNQFGKRDVDQKPAFENNGNSGKEFLKNQAVPGHSKTIVLNSLDQIVSEVAKCPDSQSDKNHTNSAQSFNHAMGLISNQNWHFLIQDCWLFVKVKKLSTSLGANTSPDYFHFMAIERLEQMGAFDQSNVQYKLKDSKEVFNEKSGAVTVSVSAFRASDISKYR